jgi:DNA repair protein RadC
MNTQKTNLAEIEISYSRNITTNNTKISCSRDADQVLRRIFPSLQHREYFYMLCLDRASQVLGFFQVSVGGMNGTIADIRIIFQTAIKANASGIIISHNHPSGNLQPSEADKALTKKIVEAGKLMDISILDHLILSNDGYFSFADENLI